MKRFLSCLVVAASLASAALADFYEGFDGDRFPTYWKYNFMDFIGTVNWQMGGGVAKAARVNDGPAQLFTPFNVVLGEEFVWTGRFGWDRSNSTSMLLKIGSTQHLNAMVYSFVSGSSRIVQVGTFESGRSAAFQVRDGWHDFRIEQVATGQSNFTQYYYFDGQLRLTLRNQGPAIGELLMTLNSKTNDPIPPMYLDYLSVSIVPEPASLAALGIGLAGYVARRRRGGRR